MVVVKEHYVVNLWAGKNILIDKRFGDKDFDKADLFAYKLAKKLKKNQEITITFHGKSGLRLVNRINNLLLSDDEKYLKLQQKVK